MLKFTGARFRGRQRGALSEASSLAELVARRRRSSLVRALARAGITDVGRLVSLTGEELAAGVGERRAAVLAEAVRKAGLSLQPSGLSDTVIERALAPAIADPGRTSLFLDYDGTVASLLEPLVGRRPLAGIPGVIRWLVQLGVAVVFSSGRGAASMRKNIANEHVDYFGSHGLEAWPACAAAAELDPVAEPHVAALESFTARCAASGELALAGLELLTRPGICTLWWGRARDPQAARRAVDRLAARAAREGLSVRRHPELIDVIVPVGVDKGTPVGRTLACGRACETLLVAGDDKTDLLLFDAADAALLRGRVRTAVRIAVVSSLTPPELIERAEVVVHGPAGLLRVLRLVASKAGGRDNR